MILYFDLRCDLNFLRFVLLKNFLGNSCNIFCGGCGYYMKMEFFIVLRLVVLMELRILFVDDDFEVGML